MDHSNLGMPETLSSVKVPLSIPQPLKKFYKGEPLALGITQIFIGILEISFGFVMDLVDDHNFYDLYFKTPIWTGITYVISGSLSVAAAQKPRMALVKGALGMNVVSAVAAGLGTVISSLSMCFQQPLGMSHSCDPYNHHNMTIKECHDLYVIPYATMYTTVAFLLTLTILEFIITIVSAAFGCASICRNTYSETTIVIFQNPTETNDPPLPAP